MNRRQFGIGVTLSALMGSVVRWGQGVRVLRAQNIGKDSVRHWQPDGEPERCSFRYISQTGSVLNPGDRVYWDGSDFGYPNIDGEVVDVESDSVSPTLVIQKVILHRAT